MIKINHKEVIKSKILSILLEAERPITVSEIAKNIQVSGRTVRNYLNELKEELKKNNITLVKKPSIGVYLDITKEKRQALKSEGKYESKDSYGYLPEYRRNYILKTLFKNKYTYTIQLFADDLYCSKSTIVNDLVHVQKWLENRGLVLKRKQNQGLWIEGNEKDYRKAMMDLFFEINDNENLNENYEIENLDYRVDFINYKKIKQLFPRLDLITIQNIVRKAEENLGYMFTDQAFINLITHIAITIERVKNNKEIKMDKEQLNTLTEQGEFEVAKWVVERLETQFNLTFPEAEIGYISLHMLGAKIQGNIHDNNYDVLLNTQNKEYVEIAKEIISLAGEILNVELSNDKLLLTALVLHLRPTIVRLKNDLKLRNPILQRIKNEYTSIFGAAWACSSIFKKKLGVLINEDEVGYIAMHLAAAVARQSNKIKTIIVCSSGIGTSQLLRTKLQNRFSELDIIATLPLNLINTEIIRQADLIVSTIQGIENYKNVVYVSTLLDEEDILKIENTINKTKRSSLKEIEMVNKDCVSIGKVNCVIDEELCFIDNERNDFIEVIEHYGKIMEDKGYAKKGFRRNILDREKKGSTIIGKGIAIPHATQEYVNNSKICIVKLNNPIIWDNQELKLVIILCLKFNDVKITKTFFKNFYSILNNDELTKKIIESNNELDIIGVFKNGGKKSE